MSLLHFVAFGSFRTTSLNLCPRLSNSHLALCWLSWGVPGVLTCSRAVFIFKGSTWVLLFYIFLGDLFCSTRSDKVFCDGATHTLSFSLSLAFLNPASLFLQWAFFISYFKMSIFHLGKACRKVQKGTNLRLVGTYFSSFYVTISAAPDLDLSAHLPLLDYARYIVSYTSIYRTFVRIFANVNSGLISASSIDGMRIGLLLPSHSFLI